MVADSNGTIYVADSASHAIRKITPNGAVSTLAGGQPGYVDGVGTSARFNGPRAIALGRDGSLYVADTSNGVIRKVTPTGAVTTIAGKKWFGGIQSNLQDGPATEATFNFPSGIAVDANGVVYVSDRNNLIRRISPSGYVTAIAGRSPGGEYIASGFVDGPGDVARLNEPGSLVADGGGTVYFADANNAIRKVSPEGTVSTVTGGEKRPVTIHPLVPNLSDLFPKGGYRDGNAEVAKFSGIRGLSIDAAGNLLVANRNPPAIRLVSPSGAVRTLVGPDHEFCALVDGRRETNVPTAVAWLPGGRIAFSVGSIVMIEK
jgi:sugar lactone lactonase YvrE